MNNFFKYPSGSQDSMELDYNHIIVTTSMNPDETFFAFNIPYKNVRNLTGIFKIGVLVRLENIDVLILPKLSLDNEIIIPSVWERRMKYVIYENEEQFMEYTTNEETLLENAIDPTEISGDGDYALINDILYHRRMAV